MPKRGPKNMVCIECGKPYIVPPAPGGIPITCSPECKRKHRNKVIQAWRDAHECPDHLHGSLTGYLNFSCDCDECRTAASAHRQSKRLGEGPEETAARRERALAKLREKKAQMGP